MLTFPVFCGIIGVIHSDVLPLLIGGKLIEYNNSKEGNVRIEFPHMQETYVLLARIISSGGEFS